MISTIRTTTLLACWSMTKKLSVLSRASCNLFAHILAGSRIVDHEDQQPSGNESWNNDLSHSLSRAESTHPNNASSPVLLRQQALTVPSQRDICNALVTMAGPTVNTCWRSDATSALLIGTRSNPCCHHSKKARQDLPPPAAPTSGV